MANDNKRTLGGAATNPFESLPLEILTSIAQRLTVWELASLQSSCKFLMRALSIHKRPCVLVSSTVARQSLASVAFLDVWTGRGMVLELELPSCGVTLEACSDQLLCFMSQSTSKARNKLSLPPLPQFAISNPFRRKSEMLPKLDHAVSKVAPHCRCNVIGVHLLESSDGKFFKLVVLWDTGTLCFVTIYDAAAKAKSWKPANASLSKDKSFLVGRRSSCLMKGVIYTVHFVKIPKKVILLVQYNTLSECWMQLKFEFPEDEEYSRRFDFWSCKLLAHRDDLFLVGTNNRPGASNWMFKLLFGQFGNPNKLVPYKITWQADSLCTDGTGNIFIKKGVDRLLFNFETGEVYEYTMLPSTFQKGLQSPLHYAVLSSRPSS